MRTLFKSLLVLFLLTISAYSEIIKEIKVNGNQRVSSETIRIFSEIKINSDLSANQLNDVIKKL